jgi:hypothetical protein
MADKDKKSSPANSEQKDKQSGPVNANQQDAQSKSKTDASHSRPKEGKVILDT